VRGIGVAVCVEEDLSGKLEQVRSEGAQTPVNVLLVWFAEFGGQQIELLAHEGQNPCFGRGQREDLPQVLRVLVRAKRSRLGAIPRASPLYACQRPSCGPRWWPTESPHPSGLFRSFWGVHLLGFVLGACGTTRPR
jgi:hypothetical protein